MLFQASPLQLRELSLLGKFYAYSPWKSPLLDIIVCELRPVGVSRGNTMRGFLTGLHTKEVREREHLPSEKDL